MQNSHIDAPFDAADFRTFTTELDHFEKLKHTRPHYPELLWHRALEQAHRHHVARALNIHYRTIDAEKSSPAPTTFNEKIYDETLCAGRMNGKVLRLVGA